jgi:L-asparaginase
VTNQHRPLIAVFSLGGTIAMTPQPDGSVAPALSAAELLAAVPALADLEVRVDVHDFRRVPGASLTFDDLTQLAATVEAEARGGVDGIVITQGTDTIEETSYFLDLCYSGEAPVIVTGAMRNPTMAGPDGPANILAALRVAASRQSRGRGCLVVFADEIHAARQVRKSHSTSITAFTSWPGPIGFVAEDAVRFHSAAARGIVLGPSSSRPVRTVIATATVGDDGEQLRVLGEHVDGLVVAAMGAGHVPQAWVPVLGNLAERIPVVLSSRTGSGSVLSKTYGFPGSESDLLARGLISAGSLPPVKARMLLHLLLMRGSSRAEVREILPGEGGVISPSRSSVVSALPQQGV